MKTQPNSIIILGLLTALTAFFATQVVVAQTPTLTTKDKVQSRVGVFQGGSNFTLDKGGHTGAAGDLAVDFGPAGTGPVYVQDATFVNALAQNDEMAVAFWAKKYDIANGSAFWFNSPSSSSGTRGFQAHVPWGDNDNIYFDTAGCCTPPQRINQTITVFPGYTGDDSWWTNWHHFVFSKKGINKEVWIDGQFFMDQSIAAVDAAPLPTDFTDLYIGSDGTGAGLYHAVVDDFTVFGTALSSNSINSLFSGTLPTALPASDKLTAWWDFNDPPSEGSFVTVSPQPNTAYGAPNLIQVIHNDGTTPWDPTNISLKIDGASVTPTFVRDGLKVTVSYVPNPIFGAQTTHKASLTYPGAGVAATLDWQFTVGAYTKDVVQSYIGVFMGGSAFSQSGAGHSGAAGDYAANYGSGTGPLHIPDATFLNALSTNDEMSFGFWMKKPGIEAGSVFWADSPSSAGDKRGFQAHCPWSDGTIYFDTAGCCDGTAQRISQNISLFPSYSGDSSWWTNWHYFVFQKKLSTKEIWIDGQLFLTGDSTKPLPTDFTDLFIGGAAPGVNLISGLIDDFSVFGTALSAASIGQLSSGALPTTLPATDKLTAYWNFNELPSSGVFTSIIPIPDSRTARPDVIRLVHWDGTTPWDASKVSLKVNDAPVSTTFVKNGIEATVTYNPSPLFAGGTTNKAALTFPGVGATLDTLEWQFVVQLYPVLDPSLSTPASSVDTTKPGFVLHVAQIDFASAGDNNDVIANQVDCANAIISGAFFPWYGANAADTSTAVASNMWNWTGPVDFNDVTSPGSFTFDALTPGIPGTGGTVDFASLFQTWIVFPAPGYYAMGVNSDDNFRVSEGWAPTRQVLHVTGNGIDKDVGAVVSTTAENNGGFGAPIPVTPIVAPVVYLNGSNCPPNFPNLVGKIAVSPHGICTPPLLDAELAYQLQKAGAVAVIIVNDPTFGFPYTMTGTASGKITIPTLNVNGFGGESDFWATNANLTASIGASQAVLVGSVDGSGGKGMSWVDFGFVVPEAGAYPFNLIYEQGNGGAGLEWCQILQDGTRVCVNDTSSASALKVYRAATVVSRPTMSIAKNGATWMITYTGTLQSAGTASGSYTDVTGATSPYTVNTATGQMFFRARN